MAEVPIRRRCQHEQHSASPLQPSNPMPALFAHRFHGSHGTAAQLLASRLMILIALLTTAAAHEKVSPAPPVIASHNISDSRPSNTSNNPTAVSQYEDTWDDCVNYLNYLRHSVGKNTFLNPTTWDGYRCAYKDATLDGPNFPSSAHGSFGSCSEAAQCEAAGMKGPSDEDGCKQGLDMYFKEGPGGGHYDIMMGDYCYMAWGFCQCSNSYGSMVTHNFYGCGEGDLTWGDISRSSVPAERYTRPKL